MNNYCWLCWFDSCESKAFCEEQAMDVSTERTGRSRRSAEVDQHDVAYSTNGFCGREPKPKSKGNRDWIRTNNLLDEHFSRQLPALCSDSNRQIGRRES